MSASPTLVIATTNPGKIPELRAILSAVIESSMVTLATPHELGFSIPPIEETGATFAENARLKAETVMGVTGLPSLADDSGLCVDALHGAPGLHSARWAGEAATDDDRNALLLLRLQAVPVEARTARYVCAAALAAPDRDTFLSEGVCEGRIAELPRGMNGFGYDPLFLIPSLGRTMAELSPAEKDTLSHRVRALVGLAAFLSLLGFPPLISP